MYRGSSFLLQRSLKLYQPLIREIAEAPAKLWKIDVDRYTDGNTKLLLDWYNQIAEALRRSGHPNPSPTLVTKIMLGVFGNVPAFDGYFRAGLGGHWNGKGSLKGIKAFYEEHETVINSRDIETFDVVSGQPTGRKYPKAKIIDMVGFIEGQHLLQD